MSGKWKRILTLLLAFMMVLSMAACDRPSDGDSGEQNPSEDNQSGDVGGDNDDGQDTADDLNETGTLRLAWTSGIGTDSLFECPWQDSQSLYHEMVFETLLKVDEMCIRDRAQAEAQHLAHQGEHHQKEDSALLCQAEAVGDYSQGHYALAERD